MKSMVFLVKIGDKHYEGNVTTVNDNQDLLVDWLAETLKGKIKRDDTSDSKRLYRDWIENYLIKFK